MSTSAVLANLKPALPQLESASPETNGIEAFKLVAAQHIASVLNIPLQQAFDGLETNKKDVDLNVPVPKFRLKAKPQELASKIADEVCSLEPQELPQRTVRVGLAQDLHSVVLRFL